MRSWKSHTISSREVHSWTLNWFVQAKLLKDHGWLCTAVVVWSIVLRAAARKISIPAACRDLANGPCGKSVFDALSDGLPKTLPVLERRLNDALTGGLPRSLRRRSWKVAIDLHLTPYYGRPLKSRNELFYGKPKDGTTKFHAYATACIVQYGQRYTLALTWVRRHETMVVVLKRLLARIQEIGLKIKQLLLDRGFFSAPVAGFLQQQNLPFLMPVMFRGRRPKKRRPKTGLQWIKTQGAGWYTHTMKRGKAEVTLSICVAYRSYRHHKNRKRRTQKLLFAAWGVHGCPTDIREDYRKRFGIESSYRQRHQAGIYTCTRDPHLRLVFMAASLVLRNMWVWIHAELLAEGRGESLTLRLHILRFKRLLDWIAQAVVDLLHDGSTPYIDMSD